MNLNQPCLVPCGCTSVDGRKCRRGDIRNTRDLVRVMVDFFASGVQEPCPSGAWCDVSVHRKCARRFVRRFFPTMPRGTVRVYEVTHSIE